MRSIVSRILVAAIILTAPGVAPYQALAQVVGSSAGGAAAVPVVPVAPVRLSGPAPAAALPGAVGLPAPAALVPAAVLGNVAPSAALPVAGTLAPAAAKRSLAGSRAMAKDTPSPQPSTLRGEGARQSLAVAAAPVSERDGAASESAREASGRAFEATGENTISAGDVEGSFSEHASGLSEAQPELGSAVASIPSPASSAVRPAASWWRSGWAKAGAWAAAAVAVVVALPDAAPLAGAIGGLPLMLGSLTGGGDAETAAREKFRQELAKLVQPGEQIGDATRVAAERAGIPPAEAEKALEQLPAGEAAKISGGWLYLGLGYPAGQAPADANARDKALAGLKLYQSPNWKHHLAAIVALEEATTLSKEAVKRTVEFTPSWPAIRAFKGNVYLKSLGDITQALAAKLKKEAEGREMTPAEKTRYGHLAAIVEWTRREHFSTKRVPEMLARDRHRALVYSFDTTKFDLGAEPGSEPLRLGLKALRGFIDGLGPEDAPKPAPKLLAGPAAAPGAPSAPAAPAARKPWLIAADDKAYENLHKFGANLTRLAAEDSPDVPPLVGRLKEIRQIVKTLIRIEKNNPLVIGEAGVGKTAIVKGLARMIAADEIPTLQGKNIFQIDMNAVLAGTVTRGMFEERMKAIIDEAKASKGKVILFIDEIHNVVGAGRASGAPHDAANILKDALSSSGIAVIGATTLDEYRVIEKDPAFAGRFKPVKVETPTVEEAVDIVKGSRERYKRKHGVEIADATVESLVRLAARYITDRQLPRSAFDLLSDAAAEVELQISEAKAKGVEPRRAAITADDIAFEIALQTGIPATAVSEDDLEALKDLPKALGSQVIGQGEAVDKVVRAIRRGRLGYKEAKQPVGTFVFLGPTGVGKTEVARVLARTMYKSEKNIVRIDMSEYQEKHSVSKLIGAPPGYVGHDGAGQLTEPVRRNAHTVVLLDEIEKAAPEVLDLLLQVIEDGRLTDSQGRVVDFSNVVLIMTSNIGGSIAGQRRKTIGFLSLEDRAVASDRAAGYLEAFKQAVRPEFFNRVGKRHVVVFNELGRPEIERILELRLADLNKRMAPKDMSVRLSDSARLALLDEAASAENRAYGARPVKQAVENDIEDALVDAELAKEIRNGDKVLVDYDAARNAYVARKDGEQTTTLNGFAALGLGGLAVSLGMPSFGWAAVAVAVGLAAGYFIVRGVSSRNGQAPDAQGPPAGGVSKRFPWLAKFGLMAGLFLALEWGVKALFVTMGWPFVYHDIVPTRQLLTMAAVPLGMAGAAYYLSLAHGKKSPLDGLNRFRAKHPIVGGAIYWALQVLTFPIGINDRRYVGDLAEKYPAVRKVVGLLDIGIAVMLAATLGNGLEAIANGRVVDFIPVGSGRANLADFFLFFGMPFVWMALDFLGAARKSDETRRPVHLSSWKYYVLPIAAVVGYILLSGAKLAGAPLFAIYGLFFAGLFGAGILISDIFLNKQVRGFNQVFRRGNSAGALLEPVPSYMSRAYRARKALAGTLAALGLAASAPRLGPADYEGLVRRFREAPPKLVILDYDDTFLDNSDGKGLVVSPERIALLERLAAAGIRVAFATNRPLDGGTYAMSHMLMERLPESLRKNFIISTGGGAEVYQYGPNGEKPAAPVKSTPLTEAEFADLKRLLREEAAKVGITKAKTGDSEDWEFREDGKGYEYAGIFKPGETRVRPLFEGFRKAIASAGYDFSVTLKSFEDEPKKKHLEPYIRVSKSSKAMAIAGILELVAAEGKAVEPEDVVMIGDDFTVPGYDSAMAKGLPGGTALAVGLGADAKLANAYLLPKVGPEQTVDFLTKISEPR